MGETIKGIKHSASPIELYQRSLCAGGSITIEWIARISQWKIFTTSVDDEED